MITQTKRAFFLAKFETVRSCKELFAVSGELLGNHNGTSLPPGTDEELCCDFSDYISRKITLIREGLDNMCSVPPHYHLFDGTVIDRFTPATEAEIKKIILESPSKSCALDPIPTSLLKYCLDELLPYITRIVNDSLLTGIVRYRIV